MFRGIIFTLIFITLYIKGFTQNNYFSNEPWDNVVSISKEKNQTVLVFIFSDSSQCKLCDEIEGNIFQNPDIMNRFSEEIIFYRVNINQKNTELNTFKNWGLKQTPTLFFISYTKDRYHKVEPISSDFDFEAMYSSIMKEFDESVKNREIIKKYNEEKGNAISIKNYIDFLTIKYPNIVLEQQLKEYLNAIPESEQESDETLKLMLDCVFFADEQLINIHLRQLKKAVKEGKVFNQYVIKERILSSIIEKIAQGTLESKINLKKSINFAEKCNQITPNFTNLSKDIFEIYYHAAARNSNKFMKKSKEYYAKNILNLNVKTLALKDSLFLIELENLILKDTTLNIEKAKALRQNNKYFSNAYAANLNFIARTIYFQQKYQNRLNFGMECAKKAVELEPNTTRLAVYGLVSAKNERYKVAYDALLEAIEMESNGMGKIDSNLSRNAYSAFLKIQKMIPQN